MKCYVINLADSPRRLAHMQASFGEVGIPFCRFDAIDRDRARIHPVAKLLAPLKEREWLASEIGCLLSHYEIWKLVSEGADGFAAVFEDDVIIDRRLRVVLSETTSLPRDADLIKLETTNQPTRLDQPTFNGPGGTQLRRLRSQHKGSGGYIVSKSAASRLVSNIGLFDAAVDVTIFSPSHEVCRNLAVYQIIPAMVIQDSVRDLSQQNPILASTIRPERIEAYDFVKAQDTILQRIIRKLSAYLVPNALSSRLVVPFGDNT